MRKPAVVSKKQKFFRVYVGCSLTGAPKKYKAQIVRLKKRLDALPGVVVLEFLGLEKGTDRDVYEHDIHRCVRRAHLFIAECSRQSLGLGIELGAAMEKWHIPTIMFRSRKKSGSRMIPGAAEYNSGCAEFVEYDSLDQLYEVAAKRIMELQRKKARLSA